MSTTNASRRQFLGKASALGAVAAVGGGTAALASSPPRGRRVTEGSPYPSFSRAVGIDRIVFVAGVVGQKPGTRDLASTAFEPQCRQAMENLKASVEASGSSMDRVLKCGVFLTDVADFPVFNKVYCGYFAEAPPARSTVVVKALVVPGAKLEIDCATCID